LARRRRRRRRRSGTFECSGGDQARFEVTYIIGKKKKKKIQNI
jgi:hypothetical protein